jgi:hypothetical protein
MKFTRFTADALRSRRWRRDKTTALCIKRTNHCNA